MKVRHDFMYSAGGGIGWEVASSRRRTFVGANAMDGAYQNTRQVYLGSKSEAADCAE